jgi:hypothetical protein
VPHDPYQLRPEERWYFVGWLAWIVAGPYLIYRGLAGHDSFLVVVGVAAILLGVSQAAVIGVRGLRPWRKPVRVAWTVIMVVGVAAYYIIRDTGK